jgi:protease IV
MRSLAVLVFLLPCAVGCPRLVVGTRVVGPVETRLDMPPVSPTAGNVNPVAVQQGVPRVAVVDVDGLILNTPFVGPLSVGENPVALFREKLNMIERDRCVRAVLLRVNSPGGGVAACIAMRHDLERFKERTKLPVVACLMDTATGGSYYIASAADQVVAGSGTVTGGLGVILNLFNLEDFMLVYNVVVQSIKSGEMADIGTSARGLTKEEKAVLQSMADEFHQRIQTDIKRTRPTIKVDKTTFDGRIFTGSQAKSRGLVDQIGDLDDALALAAQLGCSNAVTGAVPARPQVVFYRRSNDPARSIYAVTANVPLQGAGLFPSVPGLDRSKMPTFLSVWQPELSLEKLGGK